MEHKSDCRITIRHVEPQMDEGTMALERNVGESVAVFAHVQVEGCARISCEVLHRHEWDSDWRREPLTPAKDGVWTGEFQLRRPGRYRFTVMGLADHFGNWRKDVRRRLDAGENVEAQLLTGLRLILAAASRADGTDAVWLRQWAQVLTERSASEGREELFLAEELAGIVHRYPDRESGVVYDKELVISVVR